MAAATTEGTQASGQPEEAGLPQMNPEYFASQIFWRVITFGLLFVVLSRVTLPKIEGSLAARKDRIDGDLGAAEQSRKDAANALSEYETALAQARGRAHALADDNRKRIVAEIDGMKNAADLKAQEAMSKAEARIAAERVKAEGNIRAAAADAAASIVERLLGVAVTSEDAAGAVERGKVQKA